MNLLILGATGRTGKHLINEAIKEGHYIHALVRDPKKLKLESRCKFYIGSPLDQEVLRDAMHGCDAVLSTLNISRNSDFPWAPLRTPISFLSDSIKNILKIAQEKNIKRVIVTTAWGVGDTKKDLPKWFNWLIDHSNIRYPYQDHENQEQLLKLSDIEWTAVRPVGLINKDKKKPVKVSFENNPKPSLTISRKAVALFMLEILKENNYIRMTPTISQ